jgi:predicted transcriptional regulator
VTLKSWPDLRLFKCIDYAKVATFMKNNAAPLEMIAEYTDIPLAEVNNFYNACYLMGLIEKRNQIEINKKNLSNERLSLLSKINARLK